MSSLVHSLKPLNTLLVSTRSDPASVNIFDSLSRRPLWREMVKEVLYTCENKFGKIFMWMQDKPLLHLDRVDKLFVETYSEEVEFNDIIFLSKHAAASGIPSLTIHPIGIPWQVDNSMTGGLPGRCSPPSFRISSLYRSLLSETRRQGLESKYQVTLEATHHGPHADIPACFVEIGSTEDIWPVKEAGMLLLKYSKTTHSYLWVYQRRTVGRCPVTAFAN